MWVSAGGAHGGQSWTYGHLWVDNMNNKALLMLNHLSSPRQCVLKTYPVNFNEQLEVRASGSEQNKNHHWLHASPRWQGDDNPQFQSSSYPGPFLKKISAACKVIIRTACSVPVPCFIHLNGGYVSFIRMGAMFHSSGWGPCFIHLLGSGPIQNSI